MVIKASESKCRVYSPFILFEGRRHAIVVIIAPPTDSASHEGFTRCQVVGA